jgi:uncharacterized membrane protein
MDKDTTIMGPVQMLVLGFEGDHFTGEILPELRRLKDADVIRMVDLLAVRKDAEGELDVLHVSDLSPEEALEFGALAGALIGLGTGSEEGVAAGAELGAAALADGHAIGDEEVWHVADAIPPGSAAAIALLEHRWAIPLRDAIVRAGGHALADEWIHAADLVAAGQAVAAGAESRSPAV